MPPSRTAEGHDNRDPVLRGTRPREPRWREGGRVRSPFLKNPNLVLAFPPSLLAFPLLPTLPLPADIMRAFSALSAVLLFAATALALTVTSPSQETSWDASKRSQSVTWKVVTTDPSNFTVVLINMVCLHRTSAYSTFTLTYLFPPAANDPEPQC